MDVKKAATAMRPFVDRIDIINSAVYGGDATSIEHLSDIIFAIESGKVSGEKAHRWLGWLQGVVCCRGGATLEELKAVNLTA
jgi:hypothetical protein